MLKISKSSHSISIMMHEFSQLNLKGNNILEGKCQLSSKSLHTSKRFAESFIHDLYTDRFIQIFEN